MMGMSLGIVRVERAAQKDIQGVLGIDAVAPLKPARSIRRKFALDNDVI
jgi:hypothetical protein